MLRILTILLLLGACSNGWSPVEERTSFTLGQSSEHLVPHALDQTRAQFFGPSGARAMSVSARALSDPQDLFDFDRANYRRQDYYDIGLRHARSYALAGPVRSWVEVGVDLSHIDYSLPDGVSILEDPIRLSVRARSAEIAGGLSLAQGTLFAYQPELSLGGGRARTRITTHLRSSLLDVRNKTYLSDSFLTLGLRIAPSRRLSLETGLRLYEQTDYALTARVQFDLGP